MLRQQQSNNHLLAYPLLPNPLGKLELTRENELNENSGANEGRRCSLPNAFQVSSCPLCPCLLSYYFFSAQVFGSQGKRLGDNE